MPGTENLFGLLQIGQHLHKIDSLDDLLQSSLQDIVQGLKAQRGAILLADRATGKLEPRAVVSNQVKATQGRTYSNTLAHRCYSKEESLLCEVSKDPELALAGGIKDGAMSSVICVLLRSPRQKLGVLHLDRGNQMESFSTLEMRLADALAVTISAGIEAALTLVDRQHSVFIQTVTALAQAIDCRDRYTGGHTQRVTDYSLMLAEEMGISPIDLYHLQIGTPLHDIDKIGIDDAILRKPGRLTPEEFEQIKSHPVKGVEILQTIPQLASILPIVRNHHERWDGTGYPDRLAGTAIPLLARIVTVADVFDALTSARPYRRAMPADAAYNLIENGIGSQFDPQCANAFLKMKSRLTGMLESREAHPMTIQKNALADLVQEARMSVMQ